MAHSKEKKNTVDKVAVGDIGNILDVHSGYRATNKNK